MAKLVWEKFFNSDGFKAPVATFETTLIPDHEGLIPGKEAPWVSTNDVAQYGLAVIQNLALVRDSLEDFKPKA
ncbi:hypothetical protein SNK04_005718 [Fusarium graminearum]